MAGNEKSGVRIMYKIILILYVVAVLITSACSKTGQGVGNPLEKPSDTFKYPSTEVGSILDGEKCKKIKDVTWDHTYNVVDGLDYYQMKVVTDAGLDQDIYLLKVDLSKGLEAKVAISSETTSSVWMRQELSKMAVHVHSSQKPLYAIVNADFCDNREPIKPRGPVHSDGVIWASTYSLDPQYPQQGLSYVGITDEGRMVIGSREDYEAAKHTLKECTGAGVILVQDSKIQGGMVDAKTKRDPRTAIGYTGDNEVWILVVDGRHGTLGMLYPEMASIFHSLGCEAAVNLDGGGSTEMIVRNPLTNDLQICNWPSDPTDGDGGVERPRPTAWAIVKK